MKEKKQHFSFFNFRSNISLLLITVMLTAFTCSLPANSYARESEYRLKAVLIWKIIQYIDWPVNSGMNNADEPFIITVLGKNVFGETLDYISKTKKIKNRNVIIKYAAGISEIGNTDVLFLSSSNKGSLNRVLSYFTGKSVLCFGDISGFAEKGMHINFYKIGSKIRFEMNESAITAEGFKIDYRLRHIARIINRKQ